VTGGTRLRCPVDVGRACTGHLSADNIMSRSRKWRRGTVYLIGDYMIKAWALENEEHVVLFNQRRVPEREDCGVVTQDTDRLMNVAFPHGSQVAEAREETPGVEGRMPRRSSVHLAHWQNGRDRVRRRQELHPVERARGGWRGGGPGARAAPPGSLEGCTDTLGGRGGSEETFIDDKDCLRGTNNTCALGRGRHTVCCV